MTVADVSLYVAVLGEIGIIRLGGGNSDSTVLIDLEESGYAF